MNKKGLICLVLFFVSFCVFSQSVENLTDEKMLEFEMNYDFIDMIDCEAISETCAIQNGNVIVIIDGINKSVIVRSKNPGCSVKAEDCLSMVNTGVYGMCDILYKLGEY